MLLGIIERGLYSCFLTLSIYKPFEDIGLGSLAYSEEQATDVTPADSPESAKATVPTSSSELVDAGTLSWPIEHDREGGLSAPSKQDIAEDRDEDPAC